MAAAKRRTPTRASNSSVVPLVRLQRWFQGELLRPSALPSRRRPSVRSAFPASRLVLPSRTLTAKERVDVYARAYFARLHGCLAEDFPAIVQLLSEAQFHRLARLYLTRYPSRHYSLNFLGARLPKFLQGRVRVPQRALLGDIARLEVAMAQVFDAACVPALAPKELEALSPARIAGLRLRPVAAFQLLELGHAVNALVTASRRGLALPKAPRRRSWIAVWRREYNYQVTRQDLIEPQFRLLRALIRGKTIVQALQEAARVWEGSPDSLQSAVGAWFRDWAAEGLFRSLRRSR